MFDTEVVQLMVRLRGVARGIEPEGELNFVNLQGFADSQSGFFYETDTDWAEAALAGGTEDFQLSLQPFPYMTADHKLGQRMLSVGRENPWILCKHGDLTVGWFGCMYCQKGYPGWRLQFSSNPVLPALATPLAVNEATSLLHAEIEAFIGYLKAQGSTTYLSVLEELSDRSEAAAIEPKASPTWMQHLIPDACKLWSLIERLPRLSGMGSLGDTPVGDYQDFDALMARLADARCRAIEAVANSSYDDLPLINDAQRLQVKMNMFRRLSKQ